ncbi:MAG TPA: hypothetical protein DCO86_02820 [Spirochaetaceae bacterium]|nr:hypothetical protein [Spirochaetaceae bacterium]
METKRKVFFTFADSPAISKGGLEIRDRERRGNIIDRARAFCRFFETYFRMTAIDIGRDPTT